MMKKILFPTDFSENANRAFRFAIELANLFGSQILVFHSIKIIRKTGVMVTMQDVLVKDAEKDMDKILQENEKYLKNGASLTARIAEGDTGASIISAAKDWEADLIVMGTQGASGLKEIFLGSNANEVIKTSSVPVLVVPAEIAFQPVEKIVLSLDAREIGSEAILNVLREMAKAFGAKIMIYHLEAGEEDLGIDPAISSYLKGIEHSYHYELTSYALNETINEFVRDYEADMLCMIRRKRSFIEQLFHRSTTSKEVFHSAVPILILPE